MLEALKKNQDQAKDQAAGLRHLFRRRPTRIMAFASAGVPGAAQVIARCAQALTAQQRVAVVMDERGGAESIAAALGLATRFDLLQVINSDLPLRRVLLQASENLSVLPAARAAPLFNRLDRRQRAVFADNMRILCDSADFICVAAARSSDGSELSPLLLAAQQLVIVAGSGAAAVTDSYALIKRVVRQSTLHQIQIIVTGARDEIEARDIYANLRDVAQRHLQVSPRWLGWLADAGQENYLQQIDDCVDQLTQADGESSVRNSNLLHNLPHFA